jgi:putative methionine-R-sulfoxide reductase with GAF domain
MTQSREYDELQTLLFDGLSVYERMQRIADAVWDAHAEKGVSWVGFYHAPGQRTEDGRRVGDEEMLLGPSRNKPACSPIGLHGACGRACREGVMLLVHDVSALGEGYVACDPRDVAELVIPIFDEAGLCAGVLDLDSFEKHAFNERDARHLQDLLRRAGLTHREPADLVAIG